MVINRTTLVIAALIATAAALFFILGGSEEKAIRNRLSQLEQAVKKERGEPPLTTGMKFKKLTGFFTDPVTILTSYEELNGAYAQQELAQRASAARMSLDTLSLEFSGISFQSVADNSAELTLTATVRGSFKGGERTRDAQELRVSAKKIDGQWRFSAFSLVEVLER